MKTFQCPDTCERIKIVKSYLPGGFKGRKNLVMQTDLPLTSKTRVLIRLCEITEFISSSK